MSPGHGRGILCMSMHTNLLATGSSDHGIRVYDLKQKKFVKELFNKQYGHHEWVTSLSYLKDGRLVSAGMDSLICLWDAKNVKCDQFKAHGGSVSKVLTDQNNVMVSAGYDHSLMVWNLD